MSSFDKSGVDCDAVWSNFAIKLGGMSVNVGAFVVLTMVLCTHTSHLMLRVKYSLTLAVAINRPFLDAKRYQ